MKTKLMLLFTLFQFSVLSQERLDEAYLMCQYEHTYMNDTLDQTVREDFFILQIGKKISKFYSYYTFQHDSLMSTADGNRKRMETFNSSLADFRKHRDRSKFLNSFSRKRSTTCVYKNYPQGEMTVTDFLGGDYVVYADRLNEQEWEMTDSMKTILDYNCQQAICHFRGRQWIVWFAPDIPVSDGPWKLGGLPGLIMEAHDSGNQYTFNIVGLEKREETPIVWGETFLAKTKFKKSERKAFLKATKNKMDNISSFTGAETGVSMGSDKSVFFDLLERDYK